MTPVSNESKDGAVVSIELTNDEALVLFEWIAGDRERREFLDSPVGVRVLDGLEAALEAKLTEPFAANYRELVRLATERLLASSGG